MTEQELEQAFRSIVKNESKVRIWDSKQVIGRYVWWTGPTLYYNQLGDFKGPEYAHYAWGSKDICFLPKGSPHRERDKRRVETGVY